jgi:capsule polysaccharide export protein KpsC/LpsZ
MSSHLSHLLYTLSMATESLTVTLTAEVDSTEFEEVILVGNFSDGQIERALEEQALRLANKIARYGDPEDATPPKPS